MKPPNRFATQIRPAAVPARQEPSETKRHRSRAPLLDARDDPRVRKRAAHRFRRARPRLGSATSSGSRRLPMLKAGASRLYEEEAHGFLRADQPNIREALSWAVETGAAERAQHILIGAFFHWIISGLGACAGRRVGFSGRGARVSTQRGLRVGARHRRRFPARPWRARARSGAEGACHRDIRDDRPR